MIGLIQSTCVWFPTLSKKINHQALWWVSWSLTTHCHHYYLVLNNTAALHLKVQASILITGAMLTLLRTMKPFHSFKRMSVHCFDWMMAFFFVPGSQYSTVTSRTLTAVWKFTSVVIIPDIPCTLLDNLFKFLLQVQYMWLFNHSQAQWVCVFSRSSHKQTTSGIWKKVVLTGAAWSLMKNETLLMTWKGESQLPTSWTSNMPKRI